MPPKINTFQKPKILLKKTHNSTKNNTFQNSDHFLQKWKYPSKLAFLQDFRFYQWRTSILLKKLSFFSKLNTKLLLKLIVIFPKIDNRWTPIFKNWSVCPKILLRKWNFCTKYHCRNHIFNQINSFPINKTLLLKIFNISLLQKERKFIVAPTSVVI